MSDKLIEAVAKAIYERKALEIGNIRPWLSVSSVQRVISFEDARAALAAIEASGYRVVPKEPTDEMAENARNAIYKLLPSKLRAKAVYVAMLAAAPKVTP